MFRIHSCGTFLSAVISRSNPRGRRELQEFAVLLALPAHPVCVADGPVVRERVAQSIPEVFIQQDLHLHAD